MCVSISLEPSIIPVWRLMYLVEIMCFTSNVFLQPDMYEFIFYSAQMPYYVFIDADLQRHKYAELPTSTIGLAISSRMQPHG